MDHKEFTDLFEQTVGQLRQLLIVKGGEYAGPDDRLGNFKRGAQLTGVTPMQCLFIYLSKHYDAIATFIRDEAQGKDRPRSEPIEGRIDDLINYCFLLKGLLAEARGAQPDNVPAAVQRDGFWRPVGESHTLRMQKAVEDARKDISPQLARSYE